MADTTPKVYAAISAVMADMSSIGIGKNKKNEQQGFKFRGIDDVYNALAPVLSKHKLCMLPRVVSREVVERQTKSGGLLNYTILGMEFTLVSAEDGSQHMISAIGEAMDSADKSTNKAMSAAYKYACIMAFCIPVEGTPDADAETHEPAPAAKPAPKPAAKAAHHPTWPGDQARFCATLGEHSLAYDAVADWCVVVHRPRPSGMDADQRRKLLDYLAANGWKLPDPSTLGHAPSGK